ncbi:hypothetical protein TIFTF001_024257 [Ficus carica]|uniref:Uncharacterized protein n=1 Tax=Ficus carica TaxID=3494 RepID=A0AA88DEJ4_FICCA|nr:hypothetical protein TIFTF001_024257 [Ficus carica]
MRLFSSDGGRGRDCGGESRDCSHSVMTVWGEIVKLFWLTANGWSPRQLILVVVVHAELWMLHVDPVDAACLKRLKKSGISFSEWKLCD